MASSSSSGLSYNNPYPISASSGGITYTLERKIPGSYEQVFTDDKAVVLTLLQRHSGASVEINNQVPELELVKLVIRGDVWEIQKAEICITAIIDEMKYGGKIRNAFPPGELHEYLEKHVKLSPVDPNLGRVNLQRASKRKESEQKYPGIHQNLTAIDYYNYPYGQNYKDGTYEDQPRFKPPLPPLPPPPTPPPPPPSPPQYYPSSQVNYHHLSQPMVNWATPTFSHATPNLYDPPSDQTPQPMMANFYGPPYQPSQQLRMANLPPYQSHQTFQPAMPNLHGYRMPPPTHPSPQTFRAGTSHNVSSHGVSKRPKN